MTKPKPTPAFYCGLALLSFSIVKYVAYLGAAYPPLRWGCFLLISIAIAAIWVAGLVNHQGLRLKGYLNQSGFVPSAALTIPLLVALVCGVYEAWGTR